MVRWLDSLLPPKFDWIQLEVTSRCNASCSYCPCTVYKDVWSSNLISLEAFKDLSPAFNNTELVYLQGWGEPFLHPQIFHMISVAKSAGCKVGTTTNGMLLNGEKIEQLVESGIDIVGFSLAGVDEKNDTIRKGTRLEKVVNAINKLKEEKRAQGSKKPAIHIAYMLLLSGVNDLYRLPQFVGKLGVDQAVISTLTFVPSLQLQGEALIPQNKKEYVELKQNLDTTKKECENYGVELHYNLVYSGKRAPLCTENVLSSMVVAADGEVSPCVFTSLPVSEATYAVLGKERPFQRLTFGNINQEPVFDIWRKKEYKKFRESFYTNELYYQCRRCPKLYIREGTAPEVKLD